MCAGALMAAFASGGETPGFPFGSVFLGPAASGINRIGRNGGQSCRRRENKTSSRQSQQGFFLLRYYACQPGTIANLPDAYAGPAPGGGSQEMQKRHQRQNGVKAHIRKAGFPRITKTSWPPPEARLRGQPRRPAAVQSCTARKNKPCQAW